jgi:hypothetical protein
LELCSEVAAEAEEGPDGILLPPDAWERFKDEWTEDEIEDALSLVRDSLYQSELVEAADSLSARLLELLGAFGEADAFASAKRGEAVLRLEDIGQLARRVDRLEDVLDAFRTDPAPDRRGFDALRRRLADLGIEAEMEAGRDPDAGRDPQADEEEEGD